MPPVLRLFLHTPFPSSEIFRTIPVRDELLRGMLNADLVGFHIFEYARHFLTCCKRLLGLDYEFQQVRVRVRTMSSSRLGLGLGL